METLRYNWDAKGSEHSFELVRVPGTNRKPFLFGSAPNRKPIDLAGFYISSTPVTQALWLHVMGFNPAVNENLNWPVENITWNQVNEPDGFLDRLNSLDLDISGPGMRFRLPSETEWEYAARGGPGWIDDFIYSGSNDPDEVAWYGPRWTRSHDLVSRLLGPRWGWRLVGRPRFRKPTHTHEVATKAPNQLGLYDMSGNVWEWCQDVCTDDFTAVPADGSPYLGPGDERRLRGGCHHNWNLHCTVSWRYGIDPAAHDGCIGFRIVLAKRLSLQD